MTKNTTQTTLKTWFLKKPSMFAAWMLITFYNNCNGCCFYNWNI